LLIEIPNYYYELIFQGGTSLSKGYGLLVLKYRFRMLRYFLKGDMSIRASFEGAQGIVYLKPHIAIDCFLGTLELEPEIKNISSMVKVILGDAECDHQYFSVACVALDETAAEKWVAMFGHTASPQTPKVHERKFISLFYRRIMIK
jgi:hypothetical protein